MSPAISTVIMIAAVMVLVFVAMSYASNVLETRLAENEFSANRQFMATTGLQIDDVAWTVGRTQTISYASRDGFVKFLPQALTYSVEVDSGSGWTSVPQLSSVSTGMISYNMPISNYNMGNNYFERVSPRNSNAFSQSGPTAPVSTVFVIEQLPMDDGNYIRTVAVPTIRSFNSTIATTVYYKYFLPTLNASTSNPALSQSITMVGSDVTKMVLNNVDQIRITVSYPNATDGFDANFFRFQANSVTQTLQPNSVVEFYVGSVVVSIGRP